VQAKKTLGENAAIEIGTDFAFDEASNGRSLLARAGEERRELLADDFVKKRLLRLVALVVGQMDPVRDRVGVRRVSVDELRVSVCAQLLERGIQPNWTEAWSSLRV